MEANLRDRLAIVTGGGRGIGEGIVLKLAEEGAHVVVCDQDPSTAEACGARVRELGRRLLGLRVDVTGWEEVRAMVERVERELGRIDILVNNAGISPKKDGRKILIHEIEPEQWDRV